MTPSRRRRASARRPAVALALALAALCALPGHAAAHAVLQHTTPHQNAAVATAPSSVRLDFNEPVEVSFGAVRVYDERGERVDSGPVDHPGGEQSSVTIGVRTGLGRGVFTTTYRVVSADGHPVAGGFAFGVGEQVTARRGTPQVADLLARSSAGPAVEGAYGIARGMHYAALLLLAGAVFSGCSCGRPAGRRGGRRGCCSAPPRPASSPRSPGSRCRARWPPGSRSVTPSTPPCSRDRSTRARAMPGSCGRWRGRCSSW